jgi:molybdopterin-guanine dinucleotide biosynthesis protein A
MTPKLIGVILAGGRGSRLDGMDKGLLEIDGRKLIEHCVATIRPQVNTIIISANRNLAVYRQFADIVLPDTPQQRSYSDRVHPDNHQPDHYQSDLSKSDDYPAPEYSGPLSGIISVMRYLEQNQHHGSADLLTVPCDMPLLPSDLVKRLYATRMLHDSGEERVVVAHDGHRVQPLCALLSLSAKSRLESFLATGQRKVLDWVEHIDALIADFSDDPEKFININTQENARRFSDKIKNHVEY